MKQMTRDGVLTDAPNSQDRFLQKLYTSLWGRCVLKIVTRPFLSRLAGCFLSKKCSCFLIPRFIKNNNIDMSWFEDVEYSSYNEFFCRKIRDGMRPIDGGERNFISPCDSKLTVLPIVDGARFTLKHTSYSIESLLQNKALAKEFDGGLCMIFRLTVDDYHRYCYPVTGQKGENTFIQGVLHTVNPIANDVYPIYKENSRAYCVLQNDVFGKLIMMEVGALMVGKIVNHHGAGDITRGQEKGYFQFGGSTVVLLAKKDTLRIDGDILENSEKNIETVVKMGEKIGTAM